MLRYFAGEVFADALDAGALDFLLVGALLLVDAGLVEVGFVFADLGLADAGFVPVASFFGVTFVLEAFLPPVLALTAEPLALAAFGLDVEGAFFLGDVCGVRRDELPRHHQLKPIVTYLSSRRLRLRRRLSLYSSR